MLIIQMDEERFATGRQEFEWHVGEVFPVHASYLSCIDWIQADGDELNTVAAMMRTVDRVNLMPFIWKRNRNLPDSDIRLNPVQRWYGDIAKQIAWGLS